MVKVLVKFLGPIPHHEQGVALLDFERSLRRLTGLDCRVHKELMTDDSKLRRLLTDEQRAKL